MQRKTYGGIFVQQPEDIAKVLAVVQELFPFEVSYMPEHVIQVWPNPELKVVGGKAKRMLRLVYTHKFEPKLDMLLAECACRGIWALGFTGYREEFLWIEGDRS